MMNFNQLSAILAAAMTTMAGHLGAQSVNTFSVNGWSIDNDTQLQINVRSSEGNSDGSGMATPFIENRTEPGSFLPTGTWSYTVTGLTANASYSVSALVRAYNEQSAVYPSGVYLYAGDGESADISSGTSIRYDNQSSGRYATLTAVGQANADGQLVIGLRSYSHAANWISMRNITLAKMESPLQEVGLGLTYDATLNVGEGVQTGLWSTSSDGAVTYTTSDAAVATVTDGGYVTAIGAGVATITAHQAGTSAQKSATSSVTITVNRFDTWLSFWNSGAIRVGETAVTGYSTNSNAAVTYASSDPNVATVDANGVVTGVGVGSAIITASVPQTSVYKEQSATITITIESNGELLSPDVNILPAMVTLTEGTLKTMTVDVGYYDGTVTALAVDRTIATLTQTSAENRVYNYRVEGLRAGTTYIRLDLPATAHYRDTIIYVPVSVLSSLYTFELLVEGAPQFGVSIDIWGATYAGNKTFTSAHSTISAADVTVASLPNYTTSVSIEDRIITVTYTLKVPQRGSFLRLKNYSSNQYAALSADGSVLGLVASDKSLNSIIYYDGDGRFLFYRNGQFVKSTNVMASVADAASASTFRFVRGTGEYSACYSILSDDGRYVLGTGDGTTTSSVADNGYAFWSVETLSALPVEVSAAGYGYATLYSPVALDIPGGVMAYYVSRKSQVEGASGIEFELVLEKLVSLIPAGTPTILVGTPGTLYDCTLQYDNTMASPSAEATLTGQCASRFTADVAGAGNVFAMQPNAAEESVGFYRYTQPCTKGFKAYFVSDGEASAATYRLTFADAEMTTDIASPAAVTVADDDNRVYDILGHFVSDTTDGLRPGIYVRNGRKILIGR